MLTIAGSGLGPYSLEGLADRIRGQEFDALVLDRNYDNESNASILASFRGQVHFDSFAGCRGFLTDRLRENLNANILYVVTGSPLFFSGTRLILEHLEREVPGFRQDQHLSHPHLTLRRAPSSFDGLLAATTTDASETGVVSLHGRSDIDLEELLRRRHTFVLCDAASLLRLEEIFAYLDDADIEIIVGSRLGYDNERIFSLPLSEMPALKIEELNRWMPYSLLITRRFERGSLPLNENDFAAEGGMITKTDKRRLALQALALEPGMLLWDVGAGSGSVSIEGFLRHRVHTVLFEQNPGRIADIQTNLRRHRVLASRLVPGDATVTTGAEGENPDRIFLGGGGAEMAERLPVLYERLKPGGILIAHYVVLNHLSRVIGALEKASVPFRVQSISLTHFREGSLMFAETERLLFTVECKKSPEVLP